MGGVQGGAWGGVKGMSNEQLRATGFPAPLECKNARLAVGRSRAKVYSVSLLYFLHHGRSVHSPHRGCWALHTLRP